MPIKVAFLSAHADDLFSSVAAFADRELEALDVTDGQIGARRAIESAIAAARRRTKNPGSRLALIKGLTGSGKTHVLTTTLKHEASTPTSEVYPVVLQISAPVEKENYEAWLMDATIRELTARHFSGEGNQTPLRRLAGRLLERMPLAEQDEYLRLIDDLEDDGEIRLASQFALRIHRDASELMDEAPPPAAFIAAILLAGFGDASALNYLRSGVIDHRVRALGLNRITTRDERIGVLRSLGLTAQVAGASLAFAFDQVENTVRLGSEGLFIHALTQAVRIAECVHNVAIIVVVVTDEYDQIVKGDRDAVGLPPSDRDRIEHDPPFAVDLDRGSPDFFRRVISRRVMLLVQRAKLPSDTDVAALLPDWLLSRIDAAKNVREALREVATLRERAIRLGRIPTREEFEESPTVREPLPPPDCEFNKKWKDFLDAELVRHRLEDIVKAELLAWWVREASQEGTATAVVSVNISRLADDLSTPVLDISLKSSGELMTHMKLALCEAPNRNQQLSRQVELLLDSSGRAVPAALRTNGFPKGRKAQVAGALRNLEARAGFKLDLGDTEWHNLKRAKEFAEAHGESKGILAWRRDQQWLTRLLPSLSPLIAPRVSVDAQQPDAAADTEANGGQAKDRSKTSDSFPVHIGTSFEGSEVLWDPYRDPPGQLNNFSVLITGDAGSGKTQTIRVLIDAACRQGLAVTLFDFKADYCDPRFAKPLGIDVIDVRAEGLPFNPIQPPPRGASGAQPIEHAYEVAGVLARVFSLGPVQQGLLRDAIIYTYKGRGIAPREWIDPSTVEWPSFDLVLDRLRAPKGAAAASLVTKLAQLSDLGVFRSGPTESFGSFIGRRVCLELSGLPTDEMKSAIAEVIIIQLHGHALRGDQPRRLRRLMVFDEAHRVRESQRLESLAREGRAFGVGIVMGTQFPGDIPDTMAGNLATQLFLMNNQPAHRRFVATQLLGSVAGGRGQAMMERLGQLQPFEGAYLNAHYGNGIFVKVLPHHQRA